MSDGDMEGGRCGWHGVRRVFRCHQADEPAPSGADYGFEYSDEEVEEEDVDIENQYYNSKGGVGSTATVGAWQGSTRRRHRCIDESSHRFAGKA